MSTNVIAPTGIPAPSTPFAPMSEPIGENGFQNGRAHGAGEFNYNIGADLNVNTPTGPIEGS